MAGQKQSSAVDDFIYRLSGNDIAQTIIGSAAISNVDKDVRGKLQECSVDEFYDRKHKTIFTAILQLIDDSAPLDIISIADRTESIGGEDLFSYIANLAKNTPPYSSASLSYYINRHKEFYSARKAYDYFKTSAESMAAMTHPAEVLEIASRNVDSLTRHLEVVSPADDLLISGSEGFDHQVNWLVKGWIPRQAFGMLYAPPESYKSFQAIDWAGCVATGSAWSGCKVDKAPVLYVAGEGQVGLGVRVKAWEIVTKQSADNLFRLTKGVALDDLSGRRTLMQASEAIKKQTGQYPALIVIDTVNRCFGSGDENSTKDMTTFVSSLDHVKEKTGCTVLCVHHTGKDVDKGARGSSVLSGACDFEYKMKRQTAPQSYVLSSSKAKDFERPAAVYCQLRIVETGAFDDDGEPRTSLARANDAKPASDSEQELSVGGSISTEIMKVLRGRGEAPISFVITQVIHSLGWEQNKSKTEQVRREINKMIDDGEIDKVNQIISIPYGGKSFDSGMF